MIDLRPTVDECAETCQLRHQTLCLLQDLIARQSVEEVMSLIAKAYRTFAVGTVRALRMREIATKVELAGEYLFDKFGC